MPTLLRSALEPLYASTLNEWPLLGTPVNVAARFEAAPERLPDLYTALCGATGFVCGLPGLMVAPVTLPLNVAGVALLQLHMCAAIATLGGFDPASGAVREMSLRCLLGAGRGRLEQDEAAAVAARVALKAAERGTRTMGERVAMTLTKGALRRLPVVGGALSSVSDIVTTRRVAASARKAFRVAQVRVPGA